MVFCTEFLMGIVLESRCVGQFLLFLLTTYNFIDKKDVFIFPNISPVLKLLLLVDPQILH